MAICCVHLMQHRTHVFVLCFSIFCMIIWFNRTCSVSTLKEKINVMCCKRSHGIAIILRVHMRVNLLDPYLGRQLQLSAFIISLVAFETTRLMNVHILQIHYRFTKQGGQLRLCQAKSMFFHVDPASYIIFLRIRGHFYS